MSASERPLWDRWLADALLHQASVDDGNGPTAARVEASSRFASICRSVAARVLERGTDAFDWPPTPAEEEIEVRVAASVKGLQDELAAVRKERDALLSEVLSLRAPVESMRASLQQRVAKGHVDCMSEDPDGGPCTCGLTEATALLKRIERG